MMEYYKFKGLDVRNELDSIKKSSNPLQPVIEAFVNAWESINTRFSSDMSKGVISINVLLKKGLFGEEDALNFDKIQVIDNGAGLDSDSFERLTRLRDSSKNYFNKGTGRVQYLHYFDSTTITSIYEQEGELFKREVELSKRDAFMREESILRYSQPHKMDDKSKETVVSFERPLEDKDEVFYRQLTLEQLKNELTLSFIVLFISQVRPLIKLRLCVNGEEKDSIQLRDQDFYKPVLQTTIKIPYVRAKKDATGLEFIDKVEEFGLYGFKFFGKEAKCNSIRLISKGVNLPLNELKLTCMKPNVKYQNAYYTFYVDGAYIEQRTSEDRQFVYLINSQALKNGLPLEAEFITEESLSDEVNVAISSKIKEIQEAKDAFAKAKRDVQKEFYIPAEEIKGIEGKINESSSKQDIVREIYKKRALSAAVKDCQLLDKVQSIKDLNPDDKSYDLYLNTLQKLANDVLIENDQREELSQYILHRRIVLDVFDAILHKKLSAEDEMNSIRESLLHNLFFRKKAGDPASSDLWLLNEDYLHYDGASDTQFDKMSLNGESVLDLSDLNQYPDLEELFNRYKDNPKKYRPDILLFPTEGKCIIIEFKAPDVELRNHIDQVYDYAAIIRSCGRKTYNQFYCYLIGEKITESMISNSMSFTKAPASNYWFRSDTVNNMKTGVRDASLYYEIIKYSELLKRAEGRNEVFFQKLGLENKQS